MCPPSSVRQTVEFPVEGMDCGGCAREIEEALRALSGVTVVKVSLEDAKAIVQIDPAQVRPEMLHEAVKDAGFEVPR